MNRFAMAGGLSVIAAAGLASPRQSTHASAQWLREVRGQTIISNELPAAELKFGKAFRYMGGQRVNLYGNADAEQHLFVKAGMRGTVERFYMVQFEHFLPTNKRTYDYTPERTTDIGGLEFIYDVKSWPDYAAMQTEDPASDGAAFARLLARHNLAFPQKTARVRMFYLPTPDHRSELMIIFGEVLPEGSRVPVRDGGVQLDMEAPAAAQSFLEDARRDLTITADNPSHGRRQQALPPILLDSEVWRCGVAGRLYSFGGANPDREVRGDAGFSDRC